MTDRRKETLETLRTTNHNLISANAQLHRLVIQLDEQAIERERYIRYLESLISDNGFNPTKEKQC